VVLGCVGVILGGIGYFDLGLLHTAHGAKPH